MTHSVKIVQWAAGTIGTRSLRAVFEHPGMEPVSGKSLERAT